MPALVAFNRRWRVGSDDLVFPAAAGLLLRLFWLMIVSVIYGSYDDQMRRCNAPVELQAFFVGVIVLNVAVIMNEVAIVYVSMQGTILDTDARKHLPVLLYIQCALYLPEVCWTGLGTFWVSNKRHDCGIGLVIAVCVSVALQWTIMLLVFIAALVMFDPLGSHHGVDADDGNAASFTRQSTKQMWEKRCRLLCCFFAGRDEQYMNAVSDIAELLAAEFHEGDYVASDIAVGLVLLQEEQDVQQQATDQEEHPFMILDPVVTQARGKAKAVVFNKPEESLLVSEACHFMKYSLGSYGWPLYVYMNPCNGLCNLCPQLKFAYWSRSASQVVSDNCCTSNTAALKLQTNIDDEMCLKYCSYHNKIYEVPFYVALDYEKKAVVVAIRGTLSMKDALTDLTGQPEQLQLHEAEDGFAHKGMLQCALYVKSVLEEKRILEQAFTDAGETYRLVVVGHSLGAGTASLLSMLLKPTYPNLTCFAYSSPSVVSKSVAVSSEDFVVSVVLGRDIVPRLGVKNLDKLRRDLFSAIKRCRVPKYRVLMSGCWRALYFLLGPRTSAYGDRRSGSKAYRLLNPVWESNLTEPLLDSQVNSDPLSYIGRDSADVPSSSSQVEQLFPAGRILHINQRMRCRLTPIQYDVVWADREEFKQIIIHSSMLTDHLPDKVMKVLTNVASGHHPVV